MKNAGSSILRVVIQSIPDWQTDARCRYLLVVYGAEDGKVFLPLEYKSLAVLIEKLRTTGIMVQKQGLKPEDPEKACVIFTGSFEFSSDQLSKLGLRYR